MERGHGLRDPIVPKNHDTNRGNMAVCQNLVPLVNIKIAGLWMFIPLKMVLIGIDPYPNRGNGNFDEPKWAKKGIFGHGFCIAGSGWTNFSTSCQCPLL